MIEILIFLYILKWWNSKSIQNWQESPTSLYFWVKKWQMSFNVSKHKVLHLGENETNAIHKMLVSKPSVLAKERDLGVVGEKSNVWLES